MQEENRQKFEIETVEDRENKKRTKVLVAVLAAAGGAILLSFGYTVYTMMSAMPQQQQTGQQQTEEKKEKEIEADWKSHLEKRINIQEEKIMKLNQSVERLEKGNEELGNKIDQIGESIKKLSEKQSAPPLPPPPPPPPITTGQGGAVQQQGNMVIEERRPQRFEEGKEMDAVGGGDSEKAIIEFKPPSRKKEEDKDGKQSQSILRIPMGFAKAITLSGSDFPTLQYGRQNPHPVFLELVDRSILANNKKLNLKNCFLIASGWGELSSERAYLLLNKISCVTADNRLLEAQIKGWVMDDDGKVGLRGRLVSKQGAYIGRAMIAGFLQGISRILAASATTMQVSPVGTMQTINPEDAAKVGLYQGVGSAADRLARFYERMAEQIFPVIEVNGGRKVVVAFDTNGQIVMTEKKLEYEPLTKKKYELGSLDGGKQPLQKQQEVANENSGNN